jgi:hypothetical protein
LVLALQGVVVAGAFGSEFVAKGNRVVLKVSLRGHVGRSIIITVRTDQRRNRQEAQ